MVVLQIVQVAPCQCPNSEHLLVLMRDRSGTTGVRVRVAAAIGRAIAVQLGGIDSSHAGAVDLLSTVLRALDVVAEGITLSGADEALHVQLRLRTAAGTLDIGVDPSQALLIACRLDLPILIDEQVGRRSPAADVPAVYRPLLEALNLDGLSEAGGSD